MGRIKVLPDNIANKIAAGEVVERPASVAKELLENALDAGATRLRIEVEAGGRRRIQVADNGCGMGRDDAMLAFERHATSKLRDVGDLLSISTLGFRGEALPSIASVSRLMLDTRSGDEETGTRVEIVGGKMLNVTESVQQAGTTITVRDLFYNVPARRKFLRTEKTELAHIASLVTHYSLAHRDKSFHLSHDKGVLLNATPVETMRERVYQIFGSDTLQQLVELGPVSRELEIPPEPVPLTQSVANERAGDNLPERHRFTLSGFVSKPQVQKHNRDSVYVFVNQRLIRDRMVLKAISSAYHNLIPPGCFPFALLFLELPYEEVDVNVHPSKTEVRFRHHSFVHDFVRDSIRELLIASKPVSTFPVPAEPRFQAAQTGTAIPFSEESLLLRDADLPPVEAYDLRPPIAPSRQFDFGAAPPIDMGQPSAAETRYESTFQPQREIVGMIEQAVEVVPIGAELHARAPLAEPSQDTLARLGELRPLGQIRDSFIVAAGADGLWIIDQHVAHERILFEKVLLERSRGAVESQRLLMPIIVTLKPDQEIKFAQIETEFRANGFDIEPFGQRTVAVKAAPAGLSPQDVETLLHEILDTPEKDLRELSLSDLQRRVAATIACHAAIKVNMPLDAAKMHWLLDELGKSDCPMSCPHGRPIALKYGMREILKAFHRI